MASLVAVLGSMAAIASGLSVDVALAQPQPQARTVTMGRIGDRWLDTIKFRKIERATRNQTFGYNITCDLTGPDSHVLFWPRDRIDFTGRSPGYRLQVMPLGSGRLWYPDKITATSLPDVHRCILMIEGDYIKQAGGAIAASGFLVGPEAFASSGELGRTVLHELYRLTTSQSASGVSSAMATAETSAAAAFAERAFSLLGL